MNNTKTKPQGGATTTTMSRSAAREALDQADEMKKEAQAALRQPEFPSPTFDVEYDPAVQLSHIVPLSSHNPPTRTEKAKSKSGKDIDPLKDLKDNALFKNGTLVNPLKVVKNEGQYICLDGHRRMQGLHDLNYEVAPCLVYSITTDRATDKAALYEALNVQKPHKPFEQCYIYRQDGGKDFLPERVRIACEDAVNGLGETEYDSCVSARVAPTSVWKDMDSFASAIDGVRGSSHLLAKMKPWMFPGGELNEDRRKSLCGNFKRAWRDAKDKDDVRKQLAAQLDSAIDAQEPFAVKE